MTGAKACNEHFVLLKREEKTMAKQKKRTSEEMTDGEGESLVMVDGMMEKMSGAVNAPFEDEDEGKEGGQGSGSDYGDGDGGGDEKHGERVIGLAA